MFDKKPNQKPIISLTERWEILHCVKRHCLVIDWWIVFSNKFILIVIICLLPPCQWCMHKLKHYGIAEFWSTIRINAVNFREVFKISFAKRSAMLNSLKNIFDIAFNEKLLKTKTIHHWVQLTNTKNLILYTYTKIKNVLRTTINVVIATNLSKTHMVINK